MPSSPTSGGVVQDAAQLFTPLPTQPLVHIAGVPRSDGSQSCLRCLELLPNAAAVPGAYLVLLANDRYWPVAMDAWEDSRGLSCQRCRPAENEQIPQLLETPLRITPLQGLRPSHLRGMELVFTTTALLIDAREAHPDNLTKQITYEDIERERKALLANRSAKPTLCCRCAVNPAQASGICVKCED